MTDTNDRDPGFVEADAGVKCVHCGAVITFNRHIKKWVTSKDRWKCGSDPRHPVRAHTPYK